MKVKQTTLGKESETNEVPLPENWEQILGKAWRPAWSIRSRKGCLAPFIAWWKQRKKLAEERRSD